MIKIACWISIWPGSVILIPSMSPEALAFLTIGAMWIIIWKESWRWQGLWGLGTGLMIMIFHQPPDIYINPDKSLMIFHMPPQRTNLDQNLIANSLRSGRFARESWMKKMAIVECVKLKDYFKKMSQDSAQKLITSTADHLMFHFKKSDVVFQEQEKSFYCDWECRLIHQKTGNVLTFPNEQNQGGQLMWVTPWGFYQKTVAQDIGHRPWGLRVPNFKNSAP